ncbi:MAG: hypothetical protein U5K38_05460 [Woeseiaceae bacterium]|nr:hypothetical protein [Woeseiaceae bacterium]
MRPDVDPLRLVSLVQRKGQDYRMQGAHRLQFRRPMESPELRFSAIEAVLQELAPAEGTAQAATG